MKTYYIMLADGKDPLPVEGHGFSLLFAGQKLKLFVHRSTEYENLWVVSDTRSGLRIADVGIRLVTQHGVLEAAKIAALARLQMLAPDRALEVINSAPALKIPTPG